MGRGVWGVRVGSAGGAHGRGVVGVVFWGRFAHRVRVEDRTVRVWDAVSGECVLGPLEGHTDYVRSVSFLGTVSHRVRVFRQDRAGVDLDRPDSRRQIGGESKTEYYPEVVPPDKEVCSICHDNLSDTDNGYVVQLNCGHYFHSNCIRGWQNSGQRNSYSCPNCRTIATDTTYKDGILRLRF